MLTKLFPRRRRLTAIPVGTGAIREHWNRFQNVYDEAAGVGETATFGRRSSCKWQCSTILSWSQPFSGPSSSARHADDTHTFFLLFVFFRSICQGVQGGVISSLIMILPCSAPGLVTLPAIGGLASGAKVSGRRFTKHDRGHSFGIWWFGQLRRMVRGPSGVKPPFTVGKLTTGGGKGAGG